MKYIIYRKHGEYGEVELEIDVNNVIDLKKKIDDLDDNWEYREANEINKNR